MSVLPFPSFLDDVKEKGLKKAAFELVDESVQRFTAGMNIQDIREALRGEPASRKPNPRLQPHADGFWLHMRPSYYHSSMTGLYPTFRLGWLSTYFLVFEILTGLFLMIFYTPSPQIAYGNMISILSSVPLGQFMRDMHRLGAEAMVLVVTLHMLRTFFTASYKKPRQFTWFTGVILLFATLFLSFSGYLLPWDQLSLWAVTIGVSMVEAAPPEVVGQNLNLLLRGGPQFNENGLLRFYLLHVFAVPLILLIFLGVHYYKVILHGPSLQPRDENIGEDTAKRIPLDKRVYFIPDILTSEIMWIAVTTFIMVLLCVWFYHAPLENHADPQVTPLGTTAPWYFLWIQGALKLGDKFIWGILFPTIVVIFLAVVPYIDLTPSRRYAHRRFAITVCLIMVSITVLLSYMGLAEFAVSTSADAEVLHEMTKEPAHNHMGVMLPVPYDQLVVGAYTTRQVEAEDGDFRSVVNSFNEEITGNGQGEELSAHLVADKLALGEVRFNTVPADAPELLQALEKFDHMLEENALELQDAWGAVIITQNQENLKRIDVIVSWNEVELVAGNPRLDENGNPILILDEAGNPIRRTTGHHIFISQNSEYFDIYQ